MRDSRRKDTGTEARVPLTKGQRAMLVLFALSSFVVILDAASLPIPLPSILRDLGGTLAEVTWVFAAFILAFAIFLLPCVRLADLFGRRLLFLSGSSLFALSSLAAALAPSMTVLISAMVGQGIGAAMMEPAAHFLITATFPPERQAAASGAQRAGVFAGAALGPILSGFLTTVFVWQAIFWLNLLIAAVVVVGAALALPESRAGGPPRRFDFLGLLLGAPGIFFLVFPIIEGTQLGWGSPGIVGSFALAATLLALFIITELRIREPLMDFSLFKDRLFAVGTVLRGATEFASLGVFFALSHFLQVQLGYSALVTGLLLFAIIGGALFTSPLAEGLSNRIDARWLVIPGFLLVATGTFWVAHVGPQTGWAFFIAPLAIAGAGFGLLEEPTTSAAQRQIPSAQREAAWSVSYTIYLLGIGLGVAVVSGVWQSQLVDSMTTALSAVNLPPAVVTRIFTTLSEGGINGPTMERAAELIQETFAHAINTALLSCVAVAILGAVLAMFFSSRRPGGRAK